MRRVVSLLLVLAMVMGMVPASAIAESEEFVQAAEEVVVAAEEPKAEEPKAEEPKVEEPKAEEPKFEEPKTEEPKAEEPKVEEPKTEEPKAEEPKVEEPKVEEPEIEEPKVEEPETEEPKAEEPKAEEPEIEEPEIEEPETEEPKAEEPEIEEPKEETEESVSDVPESEELADVAAMPKADELDEQFDLQAKAVLLLNEPKNVKAISMSSSSIYVSWNPADSGDGYEIQMSDTSSFGVDSVIINDIATCEYLEVDLTCGKTRYYRVRTYGVLDGNTYYSEWSKTVSAHPAPDAPVDLTATSKSATSVELSWLPVPDVTGYLVYRDGEQIKVINGANKNTYLDTTLMVGGTYNYRVYSYVKIDDVRIQSENYAELEEYIVLPPVPENFKAESAGTTSIRLKWDPVAGVSGYMIYRSANNGASYPLLTTIMDPNTTSYIDTKTVYCGSEYLYYIVAYCSDTVKSERSPVVVGQALPLMPTNVKAKYQSSSEIRVSWDPMEDVTGFIVEIKANVDDAFTEIYRGSAENAFFRHMPLGVGEGGLYYVTAYVTVGGVDIKSSRSEVAYDWTRPAAIKELKLTSTRYNEITLTYPMSEGADGYEIFRSEGGAAYERIKTLETTDTEISYTDTGLDCGTNYSYKVRPYVYGGLNGVTKLYGEYCAAVTEKAKPAAPAAIAVTQEDVNQVSVTWDPVVGATSYRVYAKPVGGSSQVKGDTNAGETSFVVKDLTLGKPYVYIVRAYRKVDGVSVSGETITSEEFTLPIPQPVWGESTPVSDTSVKIRWEKIPGITGYEVKIEGLDDSYTLEKKLTGTAITLKDLQLGYRYRCYVRAYVSGVESLDTHWSNENIVQVMPNKPASLTAQALRSAYGIRLKWSKVAGVDGYFIERSTDKNGTYTEVAQVDNANTCEYNDILTDSELGMTFYYRVRSYVTSVGNQSKSPASPEASAIVVPLWPTVKLSVANAAAINIEWDPVVGADGYYIYRSTSSSGSYTEIKELDSSYTQYKVTGLTTGTRYYFKVRAFIYGANGKEILGSLSNAQSIVPCSLAPQNVAAVPYAKSVKLTWDKVSGAKGYVIYASRDGESYAQVGSVTGTSFTHSGLTSATVYKYRVSAYKEVSGNRVIGLKSSVVTTVTTVPRVPSIKATVVDQHTLDAAWGAVENVDGYEIWVRGPGETTDTKAGETNGGTRTLRLKNLSVADGYLIRVRAFVNLENGTRLYSETWRSKTFNTVTLAPTELEVLKTTKNSVTLKWKPAEDACGYKVYYKKAGAASYSQVKLDADGNLDTYILEGLNSKTKYTIMIRSLCRDSAGTLMNGQSTKTITVTTK